MVERRPIAWRERRLLAGVAILLVGLRLALAVLPYRVVRRLLDGPVSEGALSAAPTIPELRRRRMIWAVEAVGRRVLGENPCLAQALALRWMLRRHGEDSTLHIGVRKAQAGDLLAHAWLEQDGVVLIGGNQSPLEFKRLKTHHAS
jgi:Transglutaminase-like superfamily